MTATITAFALICGGCRIARSRSRARGASTRDRNLLAEARQMSGGTPGVASRSIVRTRSLSVRRAGVELTRSCLHIRRESSRRHVSSGTMATHARPSSRPDLASGSSSTRPFSRSSRGRVRAPSATRCRGLYRQPVVTSWPGVSRRAFGRAWGGRLLAAAVEWAEWLARVFSAFAGGLRVAAPRRGLRRAPPPDLVEPMGPRGVSFTQCRGAELTARVAPQALPALGAEVALALDTSRMHFFDPVSHEVLRAEAASS